MTVTVMSYSQWESVTHTRAHAHTIERTSKKSKKIKSWNFQVHLQSNFIELH